MGNEAYWICGQTEVVPVAWGEPGTGKTRSVEDFAEAVGRHCESISLSQHEPTDIGGYPKPMEKENCVKFLKPEFLENCKKQPSVLFLDELTTCQPATQAASLRLLTHAKEELKDTWVLSAANPPGCAANGYQLEPPTINRLYHHDWALDHEDWSLKMIQGFPKSKQSDFPILRDGWRDYIPRARGLIVSFLHKHKHETHKLPKEADRAQEGSALAWPSHRSWDNASILMGAAFSLGLDGDKENHPICTQLLRGTVGETATMKFIDWKTSLGFISWEETKQLIKKGKFTDKHMPNSSDKVMAYLATMFSEASQPKQINAENMDVAWELFYQACIMKHKDVAVSLKDIPFAATLKLKETNKKYDIPTNPKKIMVACFNRVQGLKE